MAFDGALTDAEQLGHTPRAALVLLDQVPHLRPGGRGEGTWVRPWTALSSSSAIVTIAPAPYSPVSLAVTSPVLM